MPSSATTPRAPCRADPATTKSAAAPPGPDSLRAGCSQRTGCMACYGKRTHLGPDACVVGHERSVRQRGPVLPHGSLKCRGAGGIHPEIQRRQRRQLVGVVPSRRGQPFNIRPEAHPARQVQRRMHAQAAVLRQRVHQAAEGRRNAAQSEVVPLGQVLPRERVDGDAADRPRQRTRGQPRAQHHRARVQRRGRAARSVLNQQTDAVRCGFAANHAAAQRHRRARRCAQLRQRAFLKKN